MGLSNLPDFSLIAHRGCRDRFPENTLEAFQAAVDEAADMIELDVALTKDRRLLVIHDDTLDRTTNGVGRVDHFTLSELQSLDAGSWFDKRFSACYLPELREVLARFGGLVNINIEIKSSYYEAKPQFASIEKQVSELVRHMNLEDSVLISSFSFEILRRLSQEPEPLHLAFLTESSTPSDLFAKLHQIDAFSWHPERQEADAERVVNARQKGIKIFVYTVNDSEELQYLKEAGINGIFTDYLQLFKEPV